MDVATNTKVIMKMMFFSSWQKLLKLRKKKFDLDIPGYQYESDHNDGDLLSVAEVN